MATKKVSALSALTSPDGAEELLINDGGTSKKITITNVSKLNLKGGDLTSASPLVIDTDGNYFVVTGTTSFAAMTVAVDRQFTLQFAAALTMTHSDPALYLPSKANITTAAGDVATFQSTTANQVQCISYTRAAGTAIVAGSSGLPTLPSGIATDTSKEYNLKLTDSSDTETLTWAEFPVSPSGISTDTNEKYSLKLTDASDTETLSWTSFAIVDDTTPQLGGDLDVNGNDIVSTSNADIDIIPHGTGDVNLGADTVQVGDNNADATITTQGTGDLILNTNNGTNAGNITLADGANGDISIIPNGTGNVGIGTTAPEGAVNISSTLDADTDFSDGQYYHLHLHNPTDTNDLDCGIGFGISSTVDAVGANIVHERKGSDSFGDLCFGTRPSGGSVTERMRIDSSGNVGIGISPSNTFSVGASGTVTTRYTSTDTSAFSLLQFENSGSIVFSADHGNSAANSDIVFKNDGAQERMRIDSSGNVGIGDTDPSEAKLSIDNVLTGDSGLKVVRNLDEAGSNPLVYIVDDHANNTQPALKIQQDGAGYGLSMTTAGRAIDLTSSATDDAAVWLVNSSCETGSGSALQVYSNSAHTGTRNVCKIHNDHASSTGTTALYVQQDSTGAAAVFDGNVGIGDTDPSEAKLSIDNVLTGDAGLKIVNTQATSALDIAQSGNGYGISVDSSGTSYAILARGKNGLYILQDDSGGNAAYFYRNIDEAGSQPLVHIEDNRASNTQSALKITHAGTGAAIKVVDGSGGISHNGMKTVVFSFSFGLNVTTDFDIPMVNTTNYFEIKAIIGYYPGTSYTTDIHGLYAYRSDSGILRVQNWSDNSSSNSGSWSVSNPDTTTLRVTKVAGASSSNARGFVEVKYRDGSL